MVFAKYRSIRIGAEIAPGCQIVVSCASDILVPEGDHEHDVDQPHTNWEKGAQVTVRSVSIVGEGVDECEQAVAHTDSLEDAQDAD